MWWERERVARGILGTSFLGLDAPGERFRLGGGLCEFDECVILDEAAQVLSLVKIEEVNSPLAGKGTQVLDVVLKRAHGDLDEGGIAEELVATRLVPVGQSISSALCKRVDKFD